MVLSIRIVGLTLVLLLRVVGSSTAQERELIPRERFFRQVERTGTSADPMLHRVYFRANNDRVVHLVHTARPDKVEEIRFPGHIDAWAPTRHGLLVHWNGVDGHCLELREGEHARDMPLPLGTERIRFLTSSPAGAERWMLEVHAPDTAVSGLYCLQLPEGTLHRRHPLPALGHLQFDGDLNLVAGTAMDPNQGNTLMVFEAGRWDTLRTHAWTPEQFLGGFSRVVSVSADGRQIHFTSNAGVDRTRLYRYDRDRKDTVLLAADAHADLLPFGMSFDAKQRPTSVVGLFAETRRHVLNPTWEQDLERAAAGMQGDLSFIATSNDERRWLLRELNGGPVRIFLFDRDTGELRYLFSEQPDLAGERLATRHAREIVSFDGTLLPAHVYLPAGSDADGDGRPDAPLPTVLYVHGGPWVGIMQWNHPFFWRNFQLLADRGYAVINAEFRGTTGLGKAMTDLGDKAWHRGMVEDHASVARWAVAQGIAQADALALWGWSFGGYSTMAGLAFHPELYAAGVAMYGISDQVAFARTPFANNAFWHARVGDPDDQADLAVLRDGSAINHIDGIRAPLFLTTGGADERVPQEQMDRMAEALQAAGKKVIYSVYPNEGHDYQQAESWISFWAGAEQFLARHLGGLAQAPGQDMELGEVLWVYGSDLLGAEP